MCEDKNLIAKSLVNLLVLCDRNHFSFEVSAISGVIVGHVIFIHPFHCRSLT